MNMKYLLLFEAFGSAALSKTVNFLGKKINKEASKSFVDTLKLLMSKYDLPLSKISDENLEYLNKKRAIRIGKPEPATNKFGVSLVKFWFSLDSGYLGYTGVGNTTVDFASWSRGKVESAVAKETFNDDEVEYIKNELGITTGILTPVVDYRNLKTGDEVVGYFSKQRDKAFLTKARIFTDDKHLKAIQNVAAGKDPKKEENNGINWREWGTYSWGIGKPDKPAADHLLLHLYQPTKDPLKLSAKKVAAENPLDYNLPLKQDGTLGKWNENWSAPLNIKTLDIADFAIIIYVDKMMKSIPSVAAIKTSRIESKKGALSLMKDEEIKNINIKNYLSAMISAMGIKKNVTELKNLQRIFTRCLCGNHALMVLYKQRPTTDYIYTFIDYLRRLLSVKSGSESKLKDVINLFESINTESLQYVKVYDESFRILNTFGSPQMKEIAQIFNNSGNKIMEYLRAQNIQTLEDLKLVFYKISSVNTILRDNDFKLSGELSHIINEFHNPNRVSEYVKNFSKFDFSKDIERLKYIYKYVESLTN